MIIQKWYTKTRQEREDRPGWLFEIHQEGQLVREQFLYDEGLQLKLALGGYGRPSVALAMCWCKDYWFVDSGNQCYMKTEGNPLSKKGQG